MGGFSVYIEGGSLHLESLLDMGGFSVYIEGGSLHLESLLYIGSFSVLKEVACILKVCCIWEASLYIL